MESHGSASFSFVVSLAVGSLGRFMLTKILDCQFRLSDVLEVEWHVVGGRGPLPPEWDEFPATNSQMRIIRIRKSKRERTWRNSFVRSCHHAVGVSLSLSSLQLVSNASFDNGKGESRVVS